MNNRALRKRRLAQLLARLSVCLLLVLCVAQVALSQEGRLVRESVHSPSLEKTLTNESPDRMVSVYLPPGYDKEPEKRYPVVYLLHGITDTDGAWINPWGPAHTALSTA
jgi:S-formylglutathione hydrolase